MITLRCTAKVLRRLGVTRPDDPPPPTGRLGDWYVNLIYSGRTQLLLIVSDVTRLPVVMPAKNLKSLPMNLPGAAAEVLTGIGVDESAVAKEVEAMSEVAIGRTASASVLATMNEYARLLKWQMLTRPERSVLWNSVQLADLLIGPRNLRCPGEVTVKLLGGRYHEGLLNDPADLSFFPRYQSEGS